MSFWVSNGMDQDQDGHSVGPDLGPNSLQRLSADNISLPWQGKSSFKGVSVQC